MTAADTTSTDALSTDERALELRRQGKGLKTIAAELGLARAVDANAAFNRALRRRPAEEQAAVRAQEQRRLDSLAEALRRKDTLSQPDLARRLRSVDRLRATLMSE